MTSDAGRFVGSAEAQTILQTNAPQIVRWRRRGGVLPPTVAVLKATPIWLRTHVEQLASARAAGDGPPAYEPLPKPLPRIVGTAEAADILGVDKSQIGRWVRGGRFPEPLQRLAAGPIWERTTIVRFGRAREADAA